MQEQLIEQKLKDLVLNCDLALVRSGFQVFCQFLLLSPTFVSGDFEDGKRGRYY